MFKKLMLTLLLLTMTNIFYASESKLLQQYQETKARRAGISEEWEKFHKGLKDTEGNDRISHAQRYELCCVKPNPYSYNFHGEEQFIEANFRAFRDKQDNKWLETVARFLQKHEKVMVVINNNLKVCRSMLATMLQTNKK